jgi:hypothetical protein
MVGQIVAYGLFVALLGAFASGPAYQHQAADQATIKLSLRHTGQLLGECRQRSPEEMLAMPANMRLADECPRERSPILLELDVDGDLAYSEVLQARGIHNDGRASAYHRMTVPAGEIRVDVRLKDHIEAEDFHFEGSHQIDLAPAQVLVIDFDEQQGRFVFL